MGTATIKKIVLIKLVENMWDHKQYKNVKMKLVTDM